MLLTVLNHVELRDRFASWLLRGEILDACRRLFIVCLGVCPAENGEATSDRAQAGSKRGQRKFRQAKLENHWSSSCCAFPRAGELAHLYYRLASCLIQTVAVGVPRLRTDERPRQRCRCGGDIDEVDAGEIQRPVGCGTSTRERPHAATVGQRADREFLSA